MIEVSLILKLTLTATATATLTFTATIRAKVCVCSGQHSDGCLSPGLLLWLRRRCPSLAPALESLCNAVVISLLALLLLLLLQSSGRKVFVQATSDVLTLTSQSELFPQNYRIILSRRGGSTKWTAQFQNVKNELRIWGWTVIEERAAFKVVMSFWCCWHPVSSATADKKGTKSGKGSEIIAMLSFFSSPDLRRTKNKRKLEEQVTAIIIWSKCTRFGHNTSGSMSFSSKCSNETN